jgi:hypothetical protein
MMNPLVCLEVHVIMNNNKKNMIMSKDFFNAMSYTIL